MTRIIMLGAGFCGLAGAMMLARDGHAVTVLERDAGPVPDSPEQAWEQWSRDGVTQFRQAHYLQSGGRAVLESTLPDVAEALEAAGGLRFNPLCTMPPTLGDRAPWSGDERFITITARRPALEQVLGCAAEREPGMDVRRGVEVERLLTRPYNGIPHVVGVRTSGGESFEGDLVVDAMGRRSQAPRMLRDIGAPEIHEEVEDIGFVYYTRYFRGSMPQPVGPLLAHIGSFSIVTLPSDNGTWSVTLFFFTGDRSLKRLRDPARWRSVIAACPLHAHWLEGEPITGIDAMGGVVDRYRRPVVDGQPVATGIALLADAWACTNPALGRGMTFGLMHAQLLRDVVRSRLDDPKDFVLTFDAATETRLTPWYRETIAENRARARDLEALRAGIDNGQVNGAKRELRIALLAAMPHDPELFRTFLDSRCCIKPLGEALARPGLAERILEIARDRELPQIPGPNREQLLRLLN